MKDKRKLLEIYAKTSTPQELFVDAIEQVQTIRQDVGKLSSELEKSLDYIYENSPKSEEELVEIIKPLIPEPKHGEKGKDGHTHTKTELREIIIPLIPEPRHGKDGSPDTPEEVRDKIKSLKGKNKLSIFDLKDTEYLRGKGKDQMNWSSTGFKVYTDATLTGDGTFSNPLSAVVSGGTWHRGIQLAIEGDNVTVVLPTAPSSEVLLTVDRQFQIAGVDYTGTINGVNKTFVFTSSVDSSLQGFIYCDYI